MDFFYPNWINDMWRIWGLIFFGDKEYFVAESSAGTKLKAFDKERCSGFAAEKGIAMYDTAYEVRRLRDNASDKFLEVVQTTDILSLLEEIPECSAIVTTGQKATDTLCAYFSVTPPSVGESVDFSIDGKAMRFYRMPSSSRAYPLAIDKKAAFYRDMFLNIFG
jgi:G:T/U-mismatch repair DNA glycosylase